MTKNTKADGTNTTNGDIPVVAPINIGKGIKWNAGTKQYDVSIAENQPIHVNDNGDLEVRVSNLEDNLLRVLDGKLYYGTKPRAELATLYVDAENGIDQDPLKVKGAGTRANPLRTFKYAASLAEKGTRRMIRLKENQDHYVIASHHFMIESGNLMVHPYGELFDEMVARDHGNGFLTTLAMISSGREPRLVFKGVYKQLYQDSTQNFDRLQTSAATTHSGLLLSFGGIRLVNDLGFDFEIVVRRYDNKDGGIRGVHINPYRLWLGEESRLELVNCRCTTIGTPNVTGAVEETSEAMRISNLKTKDPRGLYVTSFFGGFGVNISVRNLWLDTAECYLYGTHGWLSPYGADTTVNNQGTNGITDLTKRIYNARFDKLAEGVEQIIVPTTTIPTSYWKF
ncbi:hypothetical protein D3M79_04130 [Rodentibacter pneumotropicus]|uniref:Uncharacterized protein n=1 Tax=Rodentibacter pneumotropicus TaxID=758 RepID=A0A4S2PC51_9PAST|nr:hypothetical protein [Rodentibacter pneumotropicus]THA00482.1 hypothetical protein D3M79_04130 [Rodentibacter pneumotropicus]THA00733.1 hypothetical protein D3M74_07120 [Rodentibacter pneumotropicus]THA06990.1 hypothetical protein D3M77_07005 [Rodentibacter pneumotropicus]THA12645.1 hypothetical protein D3M76_09790 [Rodentibacter pneumotropicus]